MHIYTCIHLWILLIVCYGPSRKMPHVSLLHRPPPHACCTQLDSTRLMDMAAAESNASWRKCICSEWSSYSTHMNVVVCVFACGQILRVCRTRDLNDRAPITCWHAQTVTIRRGVWLPPCTCTMCVHLPYYTSKHRGESLSDWRSVLPSLALLHCSLLRVTVTLASSLKPIYM